MRLLSVVQNPRFYLLVLDLPDVDSTHLLLSAAGRKLNLGIFDSNSFDFLPDTVQVSLLGWCGRRWSYCGLWPGSDWYRQRFSQDWDFLYIWLLHKSDHWSLLFIYCFGKCQLEMKHFQSCAVWYCEGCWERLLYPVAVNRNKMISGRTVRLSLYRKASFCPLLLYYLLLQFYKLKISSYLSLYLFFSQPYTVAE